MYDLGNSPVSGLWYFSGPFHGVNQNTANQQTSYLLQ